MDQRRRDDSDDEMEEERKEARQPTMSELMRSGQSTMSLFEQMYMKSLQDAKSKEEAEDTRMAQP